MSRTPRRWTKEEDIILRQEALSQLEESDLSDWHRIAKKLPRRTNKDCRKRWCNNVTEGLKKGSWEEDEDSRLENGIQKHGHHWAAVSHVVETRSADQCAKRWSHCLNPALDRSEWSTQEDQTLMNAVEKHGRSWKSIQMTYYPGRAANHVKNRYTILRRKLKTKQQQLHLPILDPFQPSDQSSTPASSQDDEVLEDSSEVMADIESQATSPTLVDAYASMHRCSENMLQQEMQWTYSQSQFSLPTEASDTFMPNPLDLPTNVPTTPFSQPNIEDLNGTNVAPTLDLAPFWLYQPTLGPDEEPTNYCHDDLLPGNLSCSSSAPLPPASPYISTSCLSPTIPSCGLPDPSYQSTPSTDPSKNRLTTIQSSRSAMSSSRDQEASTTANTGTTDTIRSMIETPSNREAIREASKIPSSSSSRLTVTIEDPNSEAITDLMRVLAKSKGKMKLEVI